MDTPDLLFTTTTPMSTPAVRKDNFKRNRRHLPKRQSPVVTEAPQQPFSLSSMNVPFNKCSDTLFGKLKILRDMHILRFALQQGDPTFEILEFYGDALLSERISFFLLRTRRFCSPHLLTKMRTSVVQNKNLADCFDKLGVAKLFDKGKAPVVLKAKADVIEAILGELQEALFASNHIDSTLIRGVLDELIAFIMFFGEQNFFLTHQIKEAESPKDKKRHCTEAAIILENKGQTPVALSKPVLMTRALSSAPPTKKGEVPRFSPPKFQPMDSASITSSWFADAQKRPLPPSTTKTAISPLTNSSSPCMISPPDLKPTHTTSSILSSSSSQRNMKSISSRSSIAVDKSKETSPVAVPDTSLLLYTIPNTTNKSNPPSQPLSTLLSFPLPLPVPLPALSGDSFSCTTVNLGGRSVAEYRHV